MINNSPVIKAHWKVPTLTENENRLNSSVPGVPSLAALAALILLYMEFINALIRFAGILINLINSSSIACISHLGESVGGYPGVSVPSCAVCHTDAQSGTNLDCMVAGRVGCQKATTNSGYVGPGIIML